MSRSENTIEKKPASADERIQQAAQWHLLMKSGEANAGHKKNFNDWYALADNATIYRRFETLWSSFDEVDSPSARHALQQAIKKAPSSRRTGLPATALALMIVSISCLQIIPNDGVLSSYLLSGRLLSDHRTAVGEQRVIVLSDNSRLHLNTFSAVNIDYNDQQRRIHLLQGEIQLDVAKDTNRPLIVISKQGTARALGTQFSVREKEGVTDVTVTESTVEVCAHAAACQALKAGEKTWINDNQVGPTQKNNDGLFLDWSSHQLIVDDQPLLDVLDQLSRYHLGYIHIDRKALSQYRVSGAFTLNDIPQCWQILAMSLPIKITRYTPLFTKISSQ